MNGENVSKLTSANIAYDAAVKRGMGAKAAKETLQTLMFNCRHDLISLAVGDRDKVAAEEANELKLKIEFLEKQIEELNRALEESDKENNDIRRQLREMRSAQTAKKKTAGKADQGG